MTPALEALLACRKRARHEARPGWVHVEIGCGVLVRLAPRGASPCFASTRLFDVTTSNRGDLDAPQRGELAAFVAHLGRIEARQPAGLDDTTYARLVLAAWGSRGVPTARVLELAASLAGLDDAHAVGQRAMQAFLRADPSLAFGAYWARREAITAAMLGRGDVDGGAGHALVIGVPRSGTRWLFEIVQLLAWAGGGSMTVVDGLVHERGPHTGEEKPNDFFEATLAQNLYIEATERALFDACATDAPHAVDLLLAPGFRMVAKASASHSPRALIRGLRERFPRLAVASILRDPRDVLLSQRHFHAGGGGGSIEARLFEIIAWTRECKLEVEAAGGLLLRYEALLADTRAGVVDVARHLRVTLDDAAIDAVVARVSFAAMSGGRAYGERRDGEHLRGGSSHRAEFSAAEEAIVRERFGGMLRQLGYAP